MSLGLTQCKSDPCLFVLRDVGGELCAMVAVYCDDSIITGFSSSVDMIKSRIQDQVSISDLGDLRSHLGIDHDFGTDEHGSYLRSCMKDYADKMTTDYVQEFRSIRDTNSPGPTGAPSTRFSTEDEILQMERFRSFVGRLMFAAGKTEPSICNACRELSSHLTVPNVEHWKRLSHLIG